MSNNFQHALSPEDLKRVAYIIGALNSPLRTQIILMLSQEPLYVHQIVKALDQSQPLVSQHLRVLKEAGIVAPTRHGKQVVYHLIRTDIPDFLAWVAHSSAPVSSTTAEAPRHGDDDLASLRKKKIAAEKETTRSEKDTDASGSDHALGAAAIVRPMAEIDTIPDPSPAPTPGFSPMDPC
ncbi:ArsR/SmtB family transcription factor [Corynebacterium poyangense]|uniref:ArsR/SmtB family transcription factor n=1 Tax=Corynebacterium poyangense TaxID=2684405 RepID=UPI001CD01964|nr:metalloregulator ArsR/SmtB family transcription factor [Corynebacterium poyangense]